MQLLFVLERRREMKRAISGIMLALFSTGILAFSFNVQVVDAEGSWVWVRNTVNRSRIF
jgi:hypothetical protein